jgi:hypothetical protein
MEFFEALKTYIIDTRSEGLKEVTGTKLTDEFFAYQSDVKSFGWTITDIASGLSIATKLPTLKACRDFIKDMSDEFLAKIEQARLSDKYKAQCERVAAYKSNPVESLSMAEAFDLLDGLYDKVYDQKSWFSILTESLQESDLEEKKQNNGSKELAKKSWKEYFMPISDLNINASKGLFIPLISNEFAGAFDSFRETWSSYDLARLVEKINRVISSLDVSGRPKAANSEKINGVDHPIFELKLGETSSKKPIRALYFTKRDADGTRYIIFASLFIHTDKNLSATERNSGRNAYFNANPRG